MSDQCSPGPYTVMISRYGPAEAQVGDLYLPGTPYPAVVCLLHGGFWRAPHGRDQFDGVARDLASRGFAVWNVGYRRLGEPGGGWPGTFCDVADGIDHLANLVDAGIELDLSRVVVVGHSAGGHLALWNCARGSSPSVLSVPPRVRPTGAVGLAAIVDLESTQSLGAGANAVDALLGGPPGEQAERYAAASPIQLLPLGVEQLIVHGGMDAVGPIADAREYFRLATATGERIQFCELPRAGHMDYLNPDSDAHATL